MGKLLLAMMVGCALLMAGCSGDDNGTGDNNNQPMTGDPLPLAVGNAWSGTTRTTTIYDTSTVDIIYFVTADSVVGEENWYLIKSKANGTTGLFGWFTVRQDGVYVITAENDLGVAEPQMIFKFPGKVGDKYTSNLWGATYTIEIIAQNVSVTVPQGFHACCQYELRVGQSGYSGIFLGPNTGFVKMETFGSSYSYHSNWELDTLVLK
nr:hypothetical protein [candidate division Zixibacteria bacterium]